MKTIKEKILNEIDFYINFYKKDLENVSACLFERESGKLQGLQLAKEIIERI